MRARPTPRLARRAMRTPSTAPPLQRPRWASALTTCCSCQRVRGAVGGGAEPQQQSAGMGVQQVQQCAGSVGAAAAAARRRICLLAHSLSRARAGVIGRRMKMDAFVPAIPELTKSLGATAEDAHRAAVAITTTDLVSKEAALQVCGPACLPACIISARFRLPRAARSDASPASTCQQPPQRAALQKACSHTSERAHTAITRALS